MLEHLKSHLKGKVVILGIGNTLRGDDGIGSILASRLQGKVPWVVYEAGESPENYLGKIIKDKPDNIVIIDAVDFGATPGEFRVLEEEDIKSANLYATHNASITLTINYLKSDLKADIIILIVQPQAIKLGEELSPCISDTLGKLENWFLGCGQENYEKKG